MRLLLCLCLLFSGAAGLIYEVLWLRQFGLVMGQTVYALSTVISTFLGGLALGAWLTGRWLRQRQPTALLYAAVELGIAVSAAMVPWLVEHLDGIMGVAYRTWGGSLLAYSTVQLLVCAPVILVPTVLMGSTLPMAIGLLVRRAEVMTGVGTLYGLNTLGGVVGAALAGFVLLPQLGMTRTGQIAVSLNVVAALLAFTASRRSIASEAPPPTAEVASADRASRRAIGLATIYGLSGFASLTLEVAWARLVGLSIGSTTYGFSIILVTYIAGIGLGSLLLPRWRFLSSDPVRGLFLLHAVIALGSVLALGYLGNLPAYVFKLSIDVDIDATELLMWEAALVFSTIAVPTLAMGGAYPLVATLLDRIERRPATAAGFAYAANTLGNITGSLFAGFLFIPLIGMRLTIVLAALLSGAAGVLFLLGTVRDHPWAYLMRATVLTGALIGACLWAPDWRTGLITSAPYATPKAAGISPSERAPDITEVVAYEEGASTVVSVSRGFGGVLILKQDGLAEGTTRSLFHRLFGHLPLLIHDKPERVLLVGLGTGGTLSAILTHPIARVDCVEISPEVRDLTHRYFNPEALDDSRSNIIIGDGRNHLRHTDETYDVIISQPSQAWLSGASSLFTREYFAEVYDRLAPGGVAASWFSAYTLKARISILHAFTQVFPHAFLFDTQGAPSLLVGLRDDERISAANVVAGVRRPAVVDDLAALGMSDAADLLATLVTGGNKLRDVARTAPANTDDNGYVAFHGVGEGFMEPVDSLKQLAGDPGLYIDMALSTEAESEVFARQLAEAVKAWREQPLSVLERYKARQR